MIKRREIMIKKASPKKSDAFALYPKKGLEFIRRLETDGLFGFVIIGVFN